MRSKSAALPYLGLAWTSALLAGCTLGGIRVKIESDLSGSIKLFKVSMKVAAEPRPDLVLGAKQEAASAILIEERDFRFERLSEVAIGEMRFEVREGEVEGAGDEARLVIRFPLSSEAGWFKSLEITDEEVIAARKAILERADEIPPFLQGIEEKLATIQLIVKLPWRVRESKVICSAPGARKWIQESSANELKLEIPIEAVKRGAGEHVIVEAVLSKRDDGNEAGEGEDEKGDYSARFKAAMKLQGDKKFDEAIAGWLEMRDLYPEREVIDYNLACAYALQGKRAEAIAALDSSVEKGYDDVLWMLQDSDLESLRGGVEFKAIEGKAREAFLDSIDYHIQEPADHDPQKRYGLLIFMGGAGSDGSDVVPLWEFQKDRPLFQGLIVITCQYLSGDVEGIYDEDSLPRNAFTLLFEMARERWSIDPDRVVIGGFSAGAGRAFDFTMDQPKSFPRVLVIEGASRKALRDPWRVQEAKEAGFRAAGLCGEAPGLFRMVVDAQVAELRSKEIETDYRDFPQERMHKIDRRVAPFIEESIQWLLRAD